MMKDNYDLYLQHEADQERQYEQYRREWLEGELTDEEFEEIRKEFGFDV